MWTNPIGSILRWDSPAGPVTINNDLYGPTVHLNHVKAHQLQRDGIGTRKPTVAEITEAKTWAEREYSTWSDYCI